jgi:hypothetical protein
VPGDVSSTDLSMNTRIGVIALLTAGSMLGPMLGSSEAGGPVGPDERALGDPTVRVEITFDRDI